MESCSRSFRSGRGFSRIPAAGIVVISSVDGSEALFSEILTKYKKHIYYQQVSTGA